MKLGFVSAILDGWSFEEMIDTARDLGFSCVEAACWPSGKAERRYAGVSHIDVDGLTDEKAAYILGYCKERGVELSSLAFYPNTMDEDLEKRAANIAHLKKVILASEKLGVGMVTTFVGRATHKTVEENLDLIAHVERTKVEGCAFLMAASRKRVTGAFCGNPPFEERLPATLAAHTASILGGADLVRVHDVKEAVQAARMADALKRR